MSAVLAENLSKIYTGGNKAVNRISFRLERGEIFGFLGPNGAGKTTTIKLLCGMLVPSSGSCRVFDIDPAKNPEKLHQISGVITEHAQMYDHLSGIENLIFYGTLFGMNRSDCEKRAKNLLERLDLTDAQHRKLSAYSTGMRQRLSLARALMHSPEILFLDEPTSGLDPLMQHEFFEILKEYNSLGTTVFLSSHVLSEIQNNCRNAAIIREGKILLSDSVENLTHTQAKRVQLRGEVDLSSLAEVNKLERKDDTVSFLYTGPIHELLELLSRSSVIDLNISEPSLEEIFMHYYK